MPSATYTPFTTPAEMEGMMSSLGVQLRVDDPPGPSGIAEQYAKIGTNRVLFYLSRAVPDPADLSGNDWVRECATIAACYHLSGHSGEPFNDTFKQLWEEVKTDLIQIQEKKADVPGYRPAVQHDLAPQIVNVHVDMQRLPSLRRVRPASTTVGSDNLPGTQAPLWGWW